MELPLEKYPPPEPPEANPWTETIRGWPRLKAMVTDSSFWADYEPQVQDSLKTMMLVTGVYGVFKGLNGGRSMKKRWQTDNRLVLFRTVIDYKRQVHGAYIAGVVKHTWRHGVRAARFFGLLCGVQLLVNVYRNKTGFLDSWLGCTAASSVVRMHRRRGPKMMLATMGAGSIIFIPSCLLYAGISSHYAFTQSARNDRDKRRYEKYMEAVVRWKRMEELDSMLAIMDTKFSDFHLAPPQSSDSAESEVPSQKESLVSRLFSFLSWKAADDLKKNSSS